MQQIQDLKNIASQVRRDIIRMVTLAQSGHPGGSLSSTDFVTSLFFKELNCSAKTWRKDGKGNDMFFLSAGHMTPMYYSILARAGYFPVKELASFRKLGSRLQGHPSTEMNLPGVHCASGSLGQGLSVATGAALAKKANGEDNFVRCRRSWRPSGKMEGIRLGDNSGGRPRFHLHSRRLFERTQICP